MLPSPKKQEELVRRFSQTVLNELDVFQSEYEKYQEGYNAIAGIQYTPEQVKYYEGLRRPTNVWNLIFPIFNRVLGDFFLNQMVDRIFPYRGASPDAAAILNDKWEEIVLRSNYRDEFAKGILAALIKRSFYYPHWSNDRDLEGDFALKAVNEFDMIFDSRAMESDLSDCEYVARMRWMTVPQIMTLYPNHKSKLKDIMKTREESQFWESSDETMSQISVSPQFSDTANGKYKVVEFHYREYDQPAEVAYDPQTNESEILFLEGRKRELFVRSNPHLRFIETKRAKIIKICEFIPGLNFFLDQKNAEIQDGFFDYFPVSAYSYSKKVIDHFGIIQNALGPQKDFNDQRNRMLDIVNKSANATTLAKPSKIDNYEHVKSHGSEPGLVVEVKGDAELSEAYKRLDPPHNPYANQQLTESSRILLEAIVGITENMRGETQTNQENASLFAQRVREASKSMIPMDRNFKRAGTLLCRRFLKIMRRKVTGERTWYFVRPGSDIPDEVTVNMRIGDEIINNLLHGDFMIFPAPEESDPTMRAVRFMERTELIRMIVEIWGPMGVNVDFWLSDAPYEKIHLLIEQIKQTQAAMGMATEEDRAMQQAQALIQSGSALAGAVPDESPTPELRKGGDTA